MESKEVLITSSSNNNQFSAFLWDHTSCNTLNYYRSAETISAKSLCFLGRTYLIGATVEKPLIQVWPLNSQEPIKKFKIIIPDHANCLSICPNNFYVAAGIDSKLYVWHVSSGKLFNVQKKNYQAISCIKFSSDGNLLFVGGLDGMLICYNFNDLIGFNSDVTPVYSKSDHSLAINDIHVGNYGRKSRIASVSSDQTCKIYNSSSGELLLNLVLTDPLFAIILNSTCWNVYIGTNSGIIETYNLREPPRNIEQHIECDKNKNAFQGHTKKIVCLDINILGTILVSGSEDGNVFTWDINSRQVLKRFEHKGAITNVKFVLNYQNFFAQNLKVDVVLKGFEKSLSFDEDFIDLRVQDCDLDYSDDEKLTDDLASLDVLAENLKLKCFNKQLYDAALEISRKYNKF